MKINYNFSSVARYDRCIVCHRAIDKTAPGSATEPAYPAIPRERARADRSSWQHRPKRRSRRPTEDGKRRQPTLASVYGIVLAPHGQVEPRRRSRFRSSSRKAWRRMAGLQMGDIMLEVNGGRDQHRGRRRTITCSANAEWGKPLSLNDSPRPRSAVHVAPAARSVRRRHQPAQEGRDGLHDLPRRAGQRDRLQVGLAHAERPAAGARLVAQARLVRQPSLDFPDDARAVHREQLPQVPSRSGRAGAERAVPRAAGAEARQGLSPGARITAATAATKSTATTAPRSGSAPTCASSRTSTKSPSQILTDPGLNDDGARAGANCSSSARTTAKSATSCMQAIRADAALVERQPRRREAADADATPANAAPHAGDARSGRRAEGRRCARPLPQGRPQPAAPRFEGRLRLALQLDSPPGRLPARRRGCRSSSCTTSISTTKHKDFTIHDAAGNEMKVTDREYTARFENIEIRALAEFLLANSQPFEYLEPPQGITEAPSAERGKWLFESRGCLACHSHTEFPGIASNAGPRPVARRRQVQLAKRASAGSIAGSSSRTATTRAR